MLWIVTGESRDGARLVMVLEEYSGPAIGSPNQVLRTSNSIFEFRQLKILGCRLKLIWTLTNINNVLRSLLVND